MNEKLEQKKRMKILNLKYMMTFLIFAIISDIFIPSVRFGINISYVLLSLSTNIFFLTMLFSFYELGYENRFVEEIGKNTLILFIFSILFDKYITIIWKDLNFLQMNKDPKLYYKNLLPAFQILIVLVLKIVLLLIIFYLSQKFPVLTKKIKKRIQNENQNITTLSQSKVSL